MINYAEMIKSAVTVEDAARMYLPQLKQMRGRIPCPFHNGKDYNLALYGDHYFCYVCGAKGSVITFVCELFGLSYEGALEKLNNDFLLNLPLGKKPTLYQARQLKKQYSQMMEERRKQKEKQLVLEAEYHVAFDVWALYDRWKREYKPTAETAEIDSRYIVACKYIDIAAYRLELAEEQLIT